MHEDVKSDQILVFKDPNHEYRAKLSGFSCSIVNADFEPLEPDITRGSPGIYFWVSSTRECWIYFCYLASFDRQLYIRSRCSCGEYLLTAKNLFPCSLTSLARKLGGGGRFFKSSRWAISLRALLWRRLSKL